MPARQADGIVLRLRALVESLQRATPAGGRGNQEDVGLAMEELRLAAEAIEAQGEALAAAQGEALAAAQEKLERQLGRYRELFEVAPDGYLVSDGEGVILEANRAASDMLQAPAHSLVGKPLLAFVATEDHGGYARALSDAAAAHGIVETEMDLRPRGGGRLPVSVHVAASQERRGQLRWLLRDISRQRASEQQLEEALRRERSAVKRLRALDEVKDVVLLALSHDLSGPVNALLELSRMAVETEDRQGERMSRILAAIRGNALLVQRVQLNLLDVDRLTRGVVHVHRQPVHLPELVHRALTTVDSAGRSLSVHADPLTVTVDAALCERILHNLISNALNHTAGDVPVEVEARVEPGRVRLVVADHGQGVPESMRQTVFEAFTVGQSDSPSRGIGVGLYLVARFAALHGGSAWCDETPGGGARFTVELATDASE